MGESLVGFGPVGLLGLLTLRLVPMSAFVLVLGSRGGVPGLIFGGKVLVGTAVPVLARVVCALRRRHRYLRLGNQRPTHSRSRYTTLALAAHVLVQQLPGRFRLSRSGVAMFGGWAAEVELEDEERAA